MSNFTLKTSIALLLAPTVVMANTSTPHVELDPINITVSRSPQLLSKTPARVAVIGAKEIEQNPALNLSDVLQKDASISIKQYGGIGQTSEISTRGTNANHTLVLKNGARLNSQNHIAPLYPTFFDLTDIERVEISKGPASVQYGSDAIGGVVQMLSKKPIKTGASLTGIYGENSTYKAIAKGDLVADNGLYASIHGQKVESDGTRILSNQSRHEKASYDQKGYGATIGYANDHFDGNVAISQNEGVNQYYNFNTGKNNAERHFENRLINLNSSYAINNDVRVFGHYSDFKDTQNVKDNNPNHFNTQNKEADVHLKWQFTPNQNILAGVSYLDSSFKSGDVLNGAQSNDSYGYYLQHQYNNHKFDTQVGIRLEDNDRFGNHTVGQGAIRYHFNPNTSVYANIGSAFRAPALTELYYFDEGMWGNTYGNQNLKPEESTHYEVGFDHYINENTKAYLSAYRTNIDNLITYQYGYPNSTYININKADIKGGEAGVKWSKGDYFVNAEYGYAKTENKTNGNAIAYRPKQTATFSAGVANQNYGANIALVARTDAYANSNNTIKVPGYVTVDVGGYWQAGPNVKLFTNIKNIGDIEYKQAENFGNGWYIDSGRQANIGVTFSY